MPKSTTYRMTLRGHYALCFKIRAYFGAHHEILNEDRLYYQRRRCIPMTLDSGSIRLMRIFEVVLKIYVNIPDFMSFSRSCIFQPCDLVCHFPALLFSVFVLFWSVTHFQVLQIQRPRGEMTTQFGFCRKSHCKQWIEKRFLVTF